MGRFNRWSHEGAPSTEENRRIQAGIDQAMRATLASPPNNFAKDQNISPVQGVGGEAPRKGNGWVDAQPLENPPGQDVIERLANAMAPHGPESPLRKKRE